MAELLTFPTTLEQASQAAEELLDRIRQLPLDEIFANVPGVTQGPNWLVNAPEAQSLAGSLSCTTTDIQELVRHFDSRVMRLLDDLGGISAAVRSAFTDAQQLVRRVEHRRPWSGFRSSGSPAPSAAC